ncbi:hypothetical protein BDZ97DRAFT_62112 [Flammula alnicola]|nr:hypothetical protein BDZ97DRAFT_62112 [Flammula alnicola]
MAILFGIQRLLSFDQLMPKDHTVFLPTLICDLPNRFRPTTTTPPASFPSHSLASLFTSNTSFDYTVPSFSNQFDPSFSFSTHGMGDRIVVENLGFPARVSVKGIPSPPTSSSSRRPHGQQTLATAGVTMGIANIRRTSGTNEGTAIDATFRSLGVSRPPNLEATAASRVGATGTPQCSSEDTKRVVGTSAGRRAGIERRKGKAKFFCDFEGCPSSFTRRHNYDFHLKSHQGITVTCGRCYKTLAASSLKRHEKTCKGSREELQASSDAMK